MADKAQLFFEVKQYREHGYENTGITIRTGRLDTLDSLIEGCVDNKVGYYDNPGGPTGLETAARMMRRYEWLREQGYSGICRHSAYDAILDLEWQHHGMGYCEMSVKSLPRKFLPMDASARLLASLVTGGTRKRSKRVFLGDPKYMLAVLKRRGALAIDEVKIPESIDGNTWNTELCYREQGSVAVKVQVAS